MKIIGHRGAAGLATENTIDAIKAGIIAGSDAIEFDIQLTKDNHFILFHDFNLQRICGVNKLVKDATYREIKSIKTISNHSIPSFNEAIKVAGKTFIYIEVKGQNWSHQLSKQWPNVDNLNCVVLSFNKSELALFKKLKPKIKCYGLENRRPIKGLRQSKKNGFEGFTLNYRLVNPIIYIWARLYDLDIGTYTINSPLVASLYHFLYPELSITSNRPDLLVRALGNL